MEPEHITSLVTEINNEIAALETQIESLVKARTALQNICTHEFAPEGSDHNYTYEKCTICQLSRKS